MSSGVAVRGRGPGRHRERPDDGPARGGGVRADIQALRAVAVALVVVYHLAPGRLRGGFVGVDVFFVISGFLITSHLLRHPPRRPVDLLQFWSRRIRRLLPASLLVLAATLVATRLVAPDGLWRDTANQVRAAALYVVNRTLAGQQVDYLHPAAPPTPVQHFWSLSVEEQFYLCWPLVIAVLCALARRRRSVVVAGTAAIVAASLAWSVYLTTADPTAAYFATTTRMWELGAGGLLAAASLRVAHHPAAPPRPAVPTGFRVAAAWLGLLVVAGTAVLYTDGTPFPGWQAGVPVLGTLVVIAAAAPRGRWSPATPMAWRPVQYLGDISYSVYLWHWPLIILAPMVTDGRRGVFDDLVIVAATLVLAALTKRFVEDRFRTPRWGRPLPRPYVLAAATMAVVVAGAQLQLHEVADREHHDVVATRKAIEQHDPCFGAAAIRSGAARCTVETTSGRLTPAPREAGRAQSDIWKVRADGDNCFSHPPDFPVRECRFGDADGRVRIALVGNSHAAQWLPALREIGRDRHWSITTYSAIRCSLADTSQDAPDAPTRHACDRWVDAVVDRVVHGGFDLAVMSNLELYKAYGVARDDSPKAYERGYESVLRRLSARGTPVLGIRDTPFPGHSVPNCLLAHAEDYSACDRTRTATLWSDGLPTAISALDRPTVKLVDMTRWICPTERCPSAIGGVPVYFDTSHLSAAYTQTLAPMLAPALLRTLGAG